MEISGYRLTRRGNVGLLPAVMMLASKLLRQTWMLLLVALCGMIVCVGLVCAVPLFTQVTLKTGLEQVLAQQPGGKEIVYQVSSDHPTASLIRKIEQSAHPLFQKDLSGYLAGTEQFSLKTPMLNILDKKTQKPLPAQYVSVVGYDPAQISQKVTLLQGRFPQASTTPDEVEITLTQEVANKLGLHLNDVQQVRYTIAAGSAVWQLHVVGIVALRPTAGNLWHALDFSLENMNGVEQENNTTDVLASLPALLPQVEKIHENQSPTASGQQQGNALQKSVAATALMHTTTGPVITHPLQFTRNQKSASSSSQSSGGSGPGADTDPHFLLYWNYPINLAAIDGNNLGDILQDYQNVTNDTNATIEDQHIIYQYTQSPLMNQLESYSRETIFALIAIALLLLSIFGLSLFLVSLLANILIENQLPTIVMLRSRGASQRHIFGAFTLQGLILGLIALLAGPACSILLVATIGHFLMPATTQSAFSALTGDLPHTIGQIWLLALLTVVIALIIMIVSLRRASLIDIVTQRQNSSRATQVPLWKRLYLDFFLVLVLVGGVAYNQLIVTSGLGRGAILAPLAFLGVPITLLAITLLFLRFFPLMTHLGTRLITKTKAAPGVLAFAQMERQPHATLRMILLLSLALGSSIYLSSFIFTQQQRIQDAAAYQVGADFSGQIAASDPQQSLQDLQAHYAALAGVKAATVGYHTTLPGNANISSTIVNAVNADTYAQTSVWSDEYSKQSIQALTGQLISGRSAAIANDEVNVIADKQTWQEMNLSPGESFTIDTDDPIFKNIHFVASAETDYLPGLQASISDQVIASMVIDYQNFAAVYTKDNSGAQIQPNFLWLSTRDDADSLSQVRRALPALQDRRALIEQARAEPLQIAIIGTLIIGLIITLFLVLIGVGLTAWLSVKQRRMSFSILRALGMTPGQITRILLWEQGVTYLSSLAIGLFIGWLSTLFVVPAFSLIDTLLQVISVVFDNIGLPLQKSAQIPNLWLGLMLAIFLLICGATLLLVSYYGTKPALSQSLRLNED